MLHPTTFSLRQFCGIAFSPGILLGQLSGVVFQHFLFEAILRNCILKIFPSRQLSEVVLYKSIFKAILQNCIIKIFTARQLSKVVSPHFVLEQFYGVVFPQYFFQDNSTELYFQNISFQEILRNCILKIFSLGKLYGVVFPHFPLRQFYRIVFSKHFIYGNSPELYSHTFLLGNSTELYSHNTFSLRQFYRIVLSKYSIFSKHFF
jgi:hypothetical protein